MRLPPPKSTIAEYDRDFSTLNFIYTLRTVQFCVVMAKTKRFSPGGTNIMFSDSRLAGFLLITLLCTAAASAQQASPQSQAASGKIYLDVVATPKSGPPVADLQQQDFTVLDNDSPQAISSFQAVSGRQAPVEVVVVIDAINTDARNIGYERVQVDKFLRAEGGHLAYPVAIVVATDTGAKVAENFSTDGNALSAAMDHDQIGLRDIGRSAGFYGATERLQYSLEALGQLAGSEAPHQGRKILLWISPGWPLLSGPNVELDAKQQGQIFAQVVSISTQLRQARVTLYNINPIGAGESTFRGTYYEEFLKGVSKPSQVNLGNLGLQVLAIQSGGLALEFNNDVSALLQKCVSDVAPYYEISFAAPAAERPDEYHHLEIKIAKPGLTARTRQGYYAQPASAPHN
jgi:VWFA-related protein